MFQLRNSCGNLPPLISPGKSVTTEKAGDIKTGSDCLQ